MDDSRAEEGWKETVRKAFRESFAGHLEAAAERLISALDQHRRAASEQDDAVVMELVHAARAVLGANYVPNSESTLTKAISDLEEKLKPFETIP
jgi:hypothetical protein